MKKIFFLIISLLIITGCEATYTIDVDDDYNETIVITPTSTADIERFSKGTYKYPAYYDPMFMEEEEAEPLDVIRYNYKNENNIITYSYKFKGRYNDSNIAKKATGYFGSIYSTEDRLNASIVAKNFTKVFNDYPNLTKLVINVKTSKKVVANNADYVKDNIYTWYITSANKDRQISIYFENDKFYSYIDDSNKDYYDKNNQNKVTPNNNKNNNKNNNNNKNDIVPSNKTNKVLLYILYSLFFGLIFVIIIFRNKFKK